MAVRVGQKSTHTRVFTQEDVRLFGELSGDKGIHHVKPDALGRIMVQGLLTATIPTKMGGDMNYIAQNMSVQFLRPVYVGDTIKCEGEIIEVDEDSRFLRLKISFICLNQVDDAVLSGETSGVIKKSI